MLITLITAKIEKVKIICMVTFTDLEKVNSSARGNFKLMMVPNLEQTLPFPYCVCEFTGALQESVNKGDDVTEKTTLTN